MLTDALALIWLELLGRSSLSAFGLISVEVTRKNISNRNTMSVIDDIEKAASAFVLLFIAILIRFSVRPLWQRVH